MIRSQDARKSARKMTAKKLRAPATSLRPGEGHRPMVVRQ
jgi:hypothetical protein